MDQNIVQLYPTPSQEHQLEGLYLAHDLRQYGKSDNPYVYSNFITSLDGRIAVQRPDGDGLMVPKNTSNPRDWRLYQELAAQSDVIISSGRYLREWAKGRAQEILQIDDPKFADLREWRKTRGLPLYPDIAIVSSSLNFPIPDVLKKGGRKVVFFTTENPNPKRVKEIEAQAGQVVVAGENRVEGAPLIQKMSELGYKTIYSGAGPRVMHLLAKGKVLDRLYISYAHRLLGGMPFATLDEGTLLEPAIGLRLSSLYLDPSGLDSDGQLFAAYNRV